MLKTHPRDARAAHGRAGQLVSTVMGAMERSRGWWLVRKAQGHDAIESIVYVRADSQCVGSKGIF